MIALLTTYLVVAFLLIPGVLFRSVAGLFVKLRLFQLTRTQEVTLGVLVAFLPIVFANLCVWKFPLAQKFPFPYAYGSVDNYKSDYRLGLSLVVSQDPEKLLERVKDAKSPYDEAVSTIWRRQARFLFWCYSFAALEGVLYGFLARQYGEWANCRIYAWIARKFLLPNVSEWQLLLTAFIFPKNPKRDVFADVLCEEMLYKGRVADYFLDTGGKLSGLYMKDVERFRRKDYECACAESKAKSEKVDQGQFWRPIPGSNFYIPADKILNLNVRFPLQDQAMQEFLNQIVKDMDLPEGTTASFEPGEPLGDAPKKISEVCEPEES